MQRFAGIPNTGSMLSEKPQLGGVGKSVTPAVSDGCGIVPVEANLLAPLRGDFSAMARRRFQDPLPKREGNFWYLLCWQDAFENGVRTRKRQRKKLAPASMPEREVRKIAAEILRPMNQGLIGMGSAVTFEDYLNSEYIPATLPQLSSSTQDCYRGVIRKYLLPAFGSFCLRDLTPRTLQRYFSTLAIPYPSIVKVRDALSSILNSAVGTEGDFLIKNPLEGLKLPKDNREIRDKPTITPEQFNQLVQLVAEPYATMLYVAVWTGLRVSELIGLKWRCIHVDAISVRQRCCRGDWSKPKTKASAATIGVAPEVIARMLRLKTLTIEIRAGLATREYKLVKSAGPDDLVFQSVQDGKPMNDQNILRRHIKPAARALGLSFVNWRCLRTSHATWLVQAGADPKSVQGQMRHSRISTTMDIYAQIVSTAQRQAVRKLSEFARQPCSITVPINGAFQC
jgi:integrase